MFDKYLKRKRDKNEWNLDDGDCDSGTRRAYLLYGRYLQKKWGIDPDAKTPARMKWRTE